MSRKQLSDSDIEWLRGAMTQSSVNVAIGGHVDTVTDWIGGLLAERDQLRAELADIKAIMAPRLRQLESVRSLIPDGAEKTIIGLEDVSLFVLQAECAQLRAEVERLRRALHDIQHANGSPWDEDYVTMRAREALAEQTESP